MSSNLRWRSALSRAHAGRGLVVAVTVSVGACSADVTRFDFPAFNLSESDGPTGALPRSAGIEPPAPIYGASRGGYQSEGVASTWGTENTPLPPLASGERPATAKEAAYVPERARPAPASDTAPERARAPEKDGRAGQADSIEVGPNDTLYSIAKRYGVSLADLIEANGLHHGTSLKPGQQIQLPPGTLARQARRESRRQPSVALVPVAKTPLLPGAPEASAAPAQPAAADPAAAAAPPGWDGRHTLKSGESLYGIARQHRVSLTELERANGISNPLRVKVGTTLKVPGPTAPAAEPPARPAQDAPAAAKIINAPPERTVVASRSDQVSDAEPATAAAPITAAEPSSGRFRWPARGRIIAGYGRRPDGTHNDGINLALPQGAEVHAAEGGKVAYAGNELKGYGNLILIRHDNGWVSAYAHNEQLLVKRDEAVRRGQVIAKAGKTGSVDQPQLHFELRQGSKPVDPMLHLEKN
jgi:murein DD-endopeptidase MepM/ murein hydrolase activator NlpD